MKTAVSIPDDIYREAERLARSMKISRSRLYAIAIADYVARHSPDQATESMNSVCARLTTQTDPFVAAAVDRVLRATEAESEPSSAFH